ncbi:MAG: hypothetical protein LBJ59_04540 [Zoogloeaceae bacterium]|nr:hypothetical protein [Zoogloeaceae bacterium]
MLGYCFPDKHDVEEHTMQDFSSFWVNYLEYCQRAWLDMARLYTPGLTTLTGAPKVEAKGAFFPAQIPNAPSVDAWLALFTPWTPKIEAEIQPLQPVQANAVAGLAEAARVSMRVFMPWGGESWLDALAGQKKTPAAPAKQSKQEPRLTSAERAVSEAIKRSKTQD